MISNVRLTSDVRLRTNLCFFEIRVQQHTDLLLGKDASMDLVEQFLQIFIVAHGGFGGGLIRLELSTSGGLRSSLNGIFCSGETRSRNSGNDGSRRARTRSEGRRSGDSSDGGHWGGGCCSCCCSRKGSG